MLYPYGMFADTRRAEVPWPALYLGAAAAVAALLAYLAGFHLAHRPVSVTHVTQRPPPTAAPILPVPADVLPARITDTGWSWPLATRDISSEFGWRIDPFSGRLAWHDGIDLPAARGTTVHAAGSGVVRYSGWRHGYGNTVEIDHGQGRTTRYGHNLVNLVRAGDRIALGAAIALTGSSGRSTGPHLHFEWLQDGTAVDPRQALAIR